jgi:8-oxo-dGTP diphosphatase
VSAVARETFEETGIRVSAGRLAYIDEMIDNDGRTVKFWYFAEYEGGQINITANPAAGESIIDAGWFSRSEMPAEPISPPILAGVFWSDLDDDSRFPRKLPLLISYF